MNIEQTIESNIEQKVLPKIIGAKQKALVINLDNKPYGSFAEIGAGQEVAAIFFKAGAASGTVAKSMSAYDMTFSDAIYGAEESGRYVVQSRVRKMLNREYELLIERLSDKRGADSLFFGYANTVTTLNFKKDNEAHGWMGLKFQLKPNTPPNECIIHFKLLDNDAFLQQQVVGVLGVNLIYSCLYNSAIPENIIIDLLDELSRDRLEVDMFRLSGPDFTHTDNRVMALQLVKNKLTRAALFGANGDVLQATDVLYKKNILAYRGRFRPFTLLNEDMYMKGIEQFKKDGNIVDADLVTVAELTLFNLQSAYQGGALNYKDFIDRVDILCSQGYTVLISDYQGYYRLAAYLSKFTKKKIGIILGIYNLEDIFKSKLYEKLKGGVMEAFGMLFGGNVKLYVYPALKYEDKLPYNCANFEVSENLYHLYMHLRHTQQIVDIENFDADLLKILSDKVHEMIANQQSGWEEMLPLEITKTIKEKKLFGYVEKE